MAEEIRRRIRWENRERLRKLREEKHRSGNSEHKRHNIGVADVCPTITSTNKLGCLKSLSESLPVVKITSVPLTTTGPSPDYAVPSPRAISQPTAGRNEKANPEPEYHPTVLKRTRTKCLRPTVNFLDDSDDDVDLLRDAMLLAQSRRVSDRNLLPNSLRCKVSANIPATVAAVAMPKSFDDSDSDDGLLRDVKFLQEKRKADLLQTKEAPRVQNDDWGNHNLHPGENVESQPSFASLREEKGDEYIQDSESRTPQKDLASGDSLWDDLENEQPKEERQWSNKRKRSQLKVTNETRASRFTSSRSVRQSLSRGSASSSDDEDVMLLDKLMPHFDQPKLGTPSDLVPLVLKHSNRERIVPPAINRYLKGYQREGVLFLHNRIAQGKGAIL